MGEDRADAVFVVPGEDPADALRETDRCLPAQLGFAPGRIEDDRAHVVGAGRDDGNR